MAGDIEPKLLSPRRQRFVNEYLIDLNGTQAAIRAGYSPAAAQEQASRLLSFAMVKEEIARKQAELAMKSAITAEKVLKELGKIAFCDARKLYDQYGNLKPIQELDDDAAACLAGIETESKSCKGRDEEDEDAQVIVTTLRKVKRWDKVKALELIGKQLGMFVDNHEFTGNFTFVFRNPTERPPDHATRRKRVTLDHD
jgi:phage terminase small subunit